MGNALWLFLAVPQWYFSTITHPFSAWYLTMIPASGVAALAIGIVFVVLKKERAAWWTLVPIALSQLLVVIAGLFRGQLDATEWVLLPFLLLQLALSIFMIVQCRRARIAGLFLAWFQVSYALHAAFVAAMSFADSWL